MRSELAAMAAQQYGAFTWAQALKVYRPGEIRTLLRRGDWCRVFRGVYREACIPASPQLRTVAGTLLLGAGVVACRDTAAQLHEFDILESAVTHVISPRVYGSRIQGITVHREDPGDVVARWGLPVTGVARTVVDLARSYGRMDALALLDVALRNGISRAVLEAELAKHAGKRGFRQATELLGYATHKAESPMESRTRMRCIDARLPMPEARVFVPFPFETDRWLDLGWEKWKVGLEYDSIEFHTGVVAASRDTPRHNWLTSDGWTMFYATPRMVFHSPRDFIGPIRDSIASRR